MFRDYRRIEGFEDYIISNYGEVFSLKNNKVIELRAGKCTKGYFYVGLCKDGKRKSVRVHILVGNAFVGKRENRLTFDHIDRNKINNRADNIRLATYSEQMYNQNTRYSNEFGEKYIITEFANVRGYKYEYYNITVSNNGNRLKKRLNKKKFSLADAILVRNEMLL